MSDKTGIEWTDATWNPVTGCTKVSPGCDNCYAETLHERFHGKGSFATVTLHPDRLGKPLHWRKPRRVFVNSMSDLFHADVPDDYIAQVFAVMALAPEHTFQVLTKRHGRMRSLLSSDGFQGTVARAACRLVGWDDDRRVERMLKPNAHGAEWLVDVLDPRGNGYYLPDWPLPNVQLGVSVENQKWADIRIPALLDTPAAVRFLSCEPLLGPVNLARSLAGWRPEDGQPWEGNSLRTSSVLHWVIVGGESGQGARPMHPDWARSLRDQCTAAGVPFLFKQWGEWAPTSRLGVGGPHDPRERYGEVVDDEQFPQVEWRRIYRRVGKKAAGRLLDGRTWDQYPREAS